MEQVSVSLQSSIKQIDGANMDKTGTVVVDIESITQLSDRCLGSPKKFTRALSRKWSHRPEKSSTNDDDEEDDLILSSLRATLVKGAVNSQAEHLKLPLMNNTCGSCCSTLDSADGKNKRFNRFTTSINPRRILLFFATLSSMGTLILIYFTLEINRTTTRS